MENDELAQPFSPIDILQNERRSTRANVVTSLEDDPEKAARAQELADASGAHPALVHGNLENFEQQYKTSLVSKLLNDNNYLQEYANSHPLASKISNDDWGELDATSSAVQKLSAGTSSVLAKAFQGFKENFNADQMLAEHQRLAELLDKVPSAGPTTGAKNVLQAAGFAVDTAFRTFGGVIGGASAGVGELYKQLGGNPAEADRLTRDLIILAQVGLSGQAGLHGIVHPKLHEEIAKFHGTVKPYLDAGVEPPYGLHEVTDKMKEQQSKLDLGNLDEALKEAQASKTKERNPEIFAGFIRQHTDAKIGVSAEAVAKLYGDKLPTAEDGKLGWVPNLGEQLQAAIASGADIEIPLADWLAKVDPALAKELHDDLRVRPGGVTKNEVKNAAEARKVKADQLEEPKPEGEVVEPPPPTPVDAIRQASALDPLLEQPRERKLTLARTEGQEERAESGIHMFSLNDAKGKEVATIDLAEEQSGKHLYIDDIRGVKGESDINSIGPAAMRDILRQIKQEFPNAETLGGYRVSGARDKAGTWETKGAVKIRLDDPSKLSVEELNLLYPDRGFEWTTDAGITARIVPSEELRGAEKELSAKIDAIMSRVAGTEGYEFGAASKIEIAGQGAHGAYVSFDKKAPVILYALDAENAARTVRHEAIHFLKDYNFLTKGEWTTLEQEALAKDWIRKHNINQRYSKHGLDKAGMLEEAIAEEFGHWGVQTAAVAEAEGRYSAKANAVFQKMKDFFNQVREAIKEVFGHTPAVDELFHKIESGEVAKRGPGAPSGGAKDIRAQQPELPQAGTTRMEDRDIFSKAAAIGMTADQYKRYMNLIAKRNKEDLDAIAEIALKEERKHQTAEWKQNTAIVREEVAKDIRSRPDIATDEFLRSGGHKLAEEALTNEQKAALPKGAYAKTGVNPDDLAGYFGYTTGGQLVDRLVALNQARDAAGMKPEAYVRRVIDAETDRRMEAKFGKLDRNIIEEAKEHVLSETQMDLLHEETLALGMKAGSELSITKEQMKAWVQGEFDKTPLGNVSSDKYLAAAGKAGRNAEMHLLREEPGDAFKFKQQQYIAVQMANLAKKVEKERDRFEKTAKRFSAREVPTVEQDYTNFIHDILLRVGQPVKRSVQDLADSIARGEQKTLSDFVDYKELHDMREVPVAEFLLDGSFRKNLNELSVKEFQDLHDSIRTLVKNGRDEKKINKAGEEADLAEIKTKMLEQLREFKERHYDAEGKRWLGPVPPVIAKPMRTFLASVLQIESIFNRWDRGDPKGVFTQYVSRELATAANFEASLERKYSRLLSAIADKADLKAKVDNPIFMDPFSKTETDPGVAIVMTRKNLRAVLLNAGNASNLDKLARGYGVKSEVVMRWLHQTATKEDWDWAQKMGDIFAEIKKEADTMYRGLSGIEPENIPIAPITTPHGEYPGWYYPVIYHPVWEGKSKKLMGGDALEQENYVRATTPRGYTKSRTGYAAPLDLSLDQVPVRMKQMLHDIALRPAVINASKIFYDQSIRAAITKHYGLEYSKLLVPYLRDVANSANFRSDAASVGANVSEFLRQNIIATLIGLNPGTVMKHGPTAAINSLTEVGPANFLKAVKGLFSVNDATGETNWSFAMTTSEELQRRHRHWNETLGGAQQKIQDENSIRNMVMKMGAYPVAMSDLLSAVPTWLAQYEKSMREGATHGEAVFAGDRAVRRAHGSSVITNRPALMRGGPLTSWLTSLYGFFNHILNRQYELMWKAGDTLDLVKAGEWKEASKNSPELMAGLFSYILFPALVEEMVTPLSNDEKESWGKKAAKAVGFTVMSSWPIIRDIGAAALHGRDPSAGLLSTAGKTVTDIVRDLSKGKQAFDKAHAGNLIQHGVTMFGGLTGLANAQIGKSGKFIYNYSTGVERPKDFGQWWKGLRKGTLKEHH